MPNRPPIPARYTREILVESGYCCANCGTPSPLEKAHIIPWRKSKSHSPKDLICLCANCHTRADKEKWGTKSLRQLKRIPWVLRKRESVVIPVKVATAQRQRPRQISSVPKSISQEIVALNVSGDVKASIKKVLLYPDYPRWMSVGGKLVRNPVWQSIQTTKQKKILSYHQLNGSSPPRIMHLDILLIRKPDSTGRGHLQTYYSPDWGTNLLPFRQWLSEDRALRRNSLNADHLSHYWQVPPSSIEVSPLKGKYAISVKPHAKHQELIIYVFEFCSVIFHESPQLQASTKAASSQWTDLPTLRRDEIAWAVNGDVIRALHDLFTVNLRALPDSLIVHL
jgi:hypothetical protein